LKTCKLVILLISIMLVSVLVADENYTHLKHSLGSSLFLLGNIIPEDDVYAFQLDYGYRLTRKDVLIVEGIT
jgi:hypothetical protein